MYVLAFVLLVLYWRFLSGLRKYLLKRGLGLLFLAASTAGCSFHQDHSVVVSIRTLTVDLSVRYDTSITKTGCAAFASDR